MRLNGWPLEARLLAQSLPDEKTGCMNWIGLRSGRPKGNNGYGTIEVDGRSTSAHRAAWIAFVGPIPDGMCVLHKCDNRACINPDHLYIGDKKQNRADFMKRHPKAKELVAIGVKAGAAGVKRFWDSMTPIQRAEFCKQRAAKRKELYA